MPSQVAIQLGPVARFGAATTRHVASAAKAAHQRIGRVPRLGPLTATAMVSLLVVVATFDGLTELGAGFGTTSVASGVLSREATDSAVLTPLRVNVVAPFERLRPAIPQMSPPVTPAATVPARLAAPANQRRAIRAVLNRYRDALSVLDVAAVRAVWPSVDVSKVRRGFARAVEQNVEFDACDISSAGVRGTAICTGVLESGFNPSQRRPRVERKRWQFTLRKTDDRWRITNVSPPP